MALPLIDTDFTRLFTQTYSLYMGLGRWHYVFNSEFRQVALKKGWVPVTTSETMTYVKSIKAFSRVTLQTKMICWNDRRFYLEQLFIVKGQVHARALVEGLIRSPNGHLKPNEVFTALGVTQSSPEFPVSVKNWILSL